MVPRAQRFTSPALAIAAVACAVLIAVNPERASLWLAPAPIVGAIGCFLGARAAWRLRPRATGAAIVFLVLAIFWLATAAFLIGL